MRWMGLDLGERRIGIAISDPLEMTAQADSYRLRSALQADLDFFVDLIVAREIDGVVIGLPVNMNGTEGPAAEKARVFGDQLQKRISVPVIFWDERLTTASAQRVLIEADLSRSKRREKVDQLAAVFILQNYLDSKARMKN